jgi:hypothetical protein
MNALSNVKVDLILEENISISLMKGKNLERFFTKFLECILKQGPTRGSRIDNNTCEEMPSE